MRCDNPNYKGDNIKNVAIITRTFDSGGAESVAVVFI